MAETTLRAYLDELNLLLQQEALEEVIGHCRHILQHFPKNVETYRLLGTALLEKGRHKEAGDVFQRILSALPDDFTSHLGMAAVAEEGGQFPVAIWHLERAFEQQSSNPQLQSELKRLYERRDGRAPDRIQLTHGALVRVYVKGQLYDQAMTELRSALAESPDRVDLMILQAQVLWNSERTVEAAEVALEVLEKLPDSLEANRILASLWLRNGHTAEAAPFVSRLEQLDPFMAWQVVQDGKEVPREAFRLQRLAWDARSAAMLAADVPDWVSAISNVFDAPESVSLASSTNDWAADSSPTLPSSPTQLKKKTNRLDKLRTGEYTAASAPAEPTAEVPDWFSQMPAAEGFAAPSADEVPDWFKDVGAAVTPAAAASPAEMGGVELPDWFDEVVSAPAEAEAPATALPSWIDDDSSGTADSQFPSGFTDLLSGATAPAPAAAGDSGALPDWMTDDSALDNLAAEPAQALDAMSWLNTGPLPSLEQAVSASTASEPDESVTSADSALDWMSSLDAPEVADSAGASAAALFAEPADADWLSAMSFATTDSTLPGGTAESQVEAAQPAEAMPDWLDSFPASERETAASVVSGEPAPPVEDLNWLSDMSLDSSGVASAPEVEAAQPAEAIPDWLSGMSALTDDAPKSESVQTAQAAQPALEDLDWLGGAAEAESLAFDSQQAGQPAMDDIGSSGSSDLFAASGRKVGTGPLDWMTSVASEEPEPPMPVEDDPMAWLRPYQEPAASTEDASIAPSSAQALELESSDFSLDTSLDALGEPVDESAQEEGPPAWLTALMPPSDEPPAPLPDLTQPTFEDAEPAQPPPDWLSAPPTPEPAKPATGGLDWLAATAQPAEIEDDWLASFEAGTGSLESAPAASTTDDWLAQMAEAPAESTVEPTAAPAGDDWFSSLAANQPDPQVAAEASGDNWLESFATSTPDQPETQLEAPQEPEAPMTGLRRWTTMLQPLDSPGPDAALSAQPVDDKPAWMQDIESVGDSTTAESSDWLADISLPQEQEPAPSAPRFIGTLPPSKSTQETGVLSSDVLPDWLSALGDESAPAADAAPETSAPSAQLSADWLDGAMFDETANSASQDLALDLETPDEAAEVPSWLAEPAESLESTVSASSTSSDLGLDALDFGDLQVAGEMNEQDTGETPDWLSAVAPAQAAPASATPLDELDFSNLQVGEHEFAAAPGETPDWLSAVAPAQAAPASATPLDELDFSSLQFGEQSAAPADSAPESADVPSWLDEEIEKAGAGVDFTEVAQPANLVNTNVTSGDQPAPSFTFKQPPAWKRRLGGSASPQSGDDIPDWLKDPSEPGAG